MRSSMIVAITAGCLIACASPARAQTRPALLPVPPLPAAVDPVDDISPEQKAELRRWLDAMETWTRSNDRSFNRLEHDIDGNIVPRRAAPAAPAWLRDCCGQFARGESEPLEESVVAGCRLLAELSSDPAVQAIRAEIDARRRRQETPVRTSFFSRVHLDGLWSTPATSYRSYGLIGSHISLVDVGRIQIFGPPGVLLLRVPTGPGTYEMRVGYTWGLSVRLLDVRVLSSTRNATLFVSVTKCWVSSGAAEVTNPGFDIVGFSLARRQAR